LSVLRLFPPRGRLARRPSKTDKVFGTVVVSEFKARAVRPADLEFAVQALAVEPAAESVADTACLTRPSTDAAQPLVPAVDIGGVVDKRPRRHRTVAMDKAGPRHQYQLLI